MIEPLSPEETEALVAAREAGVSAAVRRFHGEPTDDAQSLEMTGEEKFGFDAGWYAAREFYAAGR